MNLQFTYEKVKWNKTYLPLLLAFSSLYDVNTTLKIGITIVWSFKLRYVITNIIILGKYHITTPLFIYEISLHRDENPTSRYNIVCPLIKVFLLQKTPTQMFSRKYCEIFKNSFFIEQLRSLLLFLISKNFTFRLFHFSHFQELKLVVSTHECVTRSSFLVFIV